MTEGKSLDGGLYSFRRPVVASAGNLGEWIKENKIPNPIPNDELHVTIVYSESAVPNYSEDPIPVWISPYTYSIGFLGDALVLHLKSPVLERQWENSVKLGAKNKWPTFHPHLSLSYEIPEDFDISDIKPFPYPIILNGEESRGMIDGWASIKGLREFFEDTPIPSTPPQINSANLLEFISWLTRQGISSKLIKMNALELKPAINSASDSYICESTFTNSPIVISQDNFILDGTKRWKNSINKDPKFKVESWKIDLPIQELFAIAHAFPKTSYNYLNA